MITKSITVYKFSELSKKAKQTAISDNYDINVDYDWWDFCYDDAAEIGLKITGFDLNYGKSCTGELTETVKDVVNKILKNHGEGCETYKLAQRYVPVLVKHRLLGDKLDEDERENDANEFLKELLKAYATILDNEYSWRMSDEQVQESIESNDYEFTADGKRFKY